MCTVCGCVYWQQGQRNLVVLGVHGRRYCGWLGVTPASRVTPASQVTHSHIQKTTHLHLGGGYPLCGALGSHVIHVPLSTCMYLYPPYLPTHTHTHIHSQHRPGSTSTPVISLQSALALALSSRSSNSDVSPLAVLPAPPGTSARLPETPAAISGGAPAAAAAKPLDACCSWLLTDAARWWEAQLTPGVIPCWTSHPTCWCSGALLRRLLPLARAAAAAARCAPCCTRGRGEEPPAASGPALPEELRSVPAECIQRPGP